MFDLSHTNIPERFRHHPLFTERHLGTNFGFMAPRGYYARPEVMKQPELMAEAGFNACTLNANVCQETFYSRRMFLDFRRSSGEIELAEIVKRLHGAGIRILLKPCLTPLDGAWMGRVDFPEGRQIEGVRSRYWEEWFESFTECSCYFAEFAERNRIEGYIAGAEYFGTEKRSEQWREVIARIREIYSGPVTYEFTPRSRKERSLDWFDAVDFLSYSYYPPASEFNGECDTFRDSPVHTLDEMTSYLSSRREKIMEISRTYGNKPIVFTEIGVRSAHGCIARPHDHKTESWYDPEEQANYMEAVFRTFTDIHCWMGFYWWKWDETQFRPHYHTDPRGDMGFTIQGKPAEQVMRRYLQQSRSEERK